MRQTKRPLNIICFATFFKGADFLRECKAQGGRGTLVTKEKMLNEDWPRDVLDELFALPNDASVELFLDLVAHIAKTNKPDRIVALEEFDVVVAALAREHLCMSGMTSSTAKTFRDKYAMAVRARDGGVTIPDVVPAINNDEIADYMNRVPAPWVLKPRSDVSAIGIRKLENADEAWTAIEELNKRQALRERASYHVLARFIPGEVFHVDSLVHDGRVIFAGVNKYGRRLHQYRRPASASRPWRRRVYLANHSPRLSRKEEVAGNQSPLNQGDENGNGRHPCGVHQERCGWRFLFSGNRRARRWRIHS